MISAILTAFREDKMRRQEAKERDEMSRTLALIERSIWMAARPVVLRYRGSKYASPSLGRREEKR